MWTDDVIAEYRAQQELERQQRAEKLREMMLEFLNVEIEPKCGLYLFEENRGVCVGQDVYKQDCILFFKRTGSDTFFSDPIQDRIKAGHELLRHMLWTTARAVGSDFLVDWSYLEYLKGNNNVVR